MRWVGAVIMAGIIFIVICQHSMVTDSGVRSQRGDQWRPPEPESAEWHPEWSQSSPAPGHEWRPPPVIPAWQPWRRTSLDQTWHEGRCLPVTTWLGRMMARLRLAVVSLATLELSLPGEMTDSCQFPGAWRGAWHHLGHDEPLNVTADNIDTKVEWDKSSGQSQLLS